MSEEKENDLNENEVVKGVNKIEVGQSALTNKSGEKNEPASKNNKGIKKHWYIILIVIIVLSVGGYFAYKYLNKEETNKEDDINKEQEITYKQYEYNSFSLIDFQERLGGYYFKEVYKANEIVSFELGYEMYNGYGIKELSYKLNYGPGLKLIDQINGDNDCLSFSDKKGITTMTIEKDCIDTHGEYCDVVREYQFKIMDGYTSKDLYVEITDIKFKTVGNEYFVHPDVSNNLTLKSNIYYIYEENDEYSTYIRVSDVKLDDEGLNEVSEYKCDSNDCEFIDDSGNYILFNDFGLVAYDYKKKKTLELNYPEIDYRVEQLVADDKIHGIIVENDGKYGYYSFELDKYVVPMSEKNSLYYDSAGFIENRGDEWNIVDLQGNKFVPDISKLENIEGTDFYYYTYFCGLEDCLYSFYTKSGFNIAVDGTFYGYTITDNKDLLLIDETDEKKNTFDIYDSEGNKIYTSKLYNSVYDLGVDDYLAVIDTDNYLKLINSKEEVLASFTEMTEEKYFHDMISGWYEYNNKNGIYLVVEDPNVTVEEVLENNKNYTKDDIEWIKEDGGYEYYYIPKTGETGKIPTAIGGYAKPVLYLYPEKNNTKINVTFEKPGLLTTTYPKFNKSWSVTANKNGDLYDNEGKYYYGLYWEEEGSTKVDFSEGFYVTKDNAIEFLEEKLSIIGLSDRERNEFIMYWLPILEKNEKNLVYFELTEEREKFNKLNITPKPDSLLRLAIHVKKVNKKINIKEQKLKTFERVGFTAVEWGGVVH